MSKNFYLYGVFKKHGVELIEEVVKSISTKYFIPYIIVNPPHIFTQPKTKKQLLPYKISLSEEIFHENSNVIETRFEDLGVISAKWNDVYSCDISIFNIEDKSYICDINIYLNIRFDQNNVSELFRTTNISIVSPSVLKHSFVDFISILEPLFKSEYFVAGGVSLDGAPSRGRFLAIITKKGEAISSDTLGMIPVEGDLIGCSECELFLDRKDRI
jgi:hypothetical protein